MNESELEQIQSEIAGYRQLLLQSDYKALKHADGALTDEEYEPVRAERQELRDKINALELQAEMSGIDIQML